jgi:single-strand DNA-binding protein
MADTHVTITGNLTDDPELRFTPNGAAVANFRVAVTARVRDGETWRDGDTSYFRINCWRQLAEHVIPKLAPGSPEVVPVRVRG